nr:MAG TPA: hypothetical protein [Bacteriophage sp.]
MPKRISFFIIVTSIRQIRNPPRSLAPCRPELTSHDFILFAPK